ncbi:MAG TPA: DsbA family protein [Candidatus Acidoferrum sp.]|nr:DsbA family protein [Candidatus Acidoferrum sp.]
MKAWFPAAALAVMVALAAIAVPASAQQNETLTDQAKIEQIVHDYLMAHPEVIIEAVDKYQKDQEKASAQKQAQALVDRRDELLHTAADPVIGNANGDVTIVEFFDYRCPYCKSVAASFIDLYEKDGKVRLVLKEFPILGPESEFASKAALAAQKQGKYREFHLAMMTFKGKLTDDDVRNLAKQVGIDVAKLEQDMKDPSVADTINRNYALAEALGIKGTPAFILGNELVPGAITADEMQKRIAALRNPPG